MQSALGIWDRVEVPSEARNYHQHMRRAMVFEKQAFDTMNRYYRLGRLDTPRFAGEYAQLREQAMLLSVEKDGALKAAIETEPGRK